MKVKCLDCKFYKPIVVEDTTNKDGSIHKGFIMESVCRCENGFMYMGRLGRHKIPDLERECEGFRPQGE